MTIQELIDELQEAIENGYKPDTRICVDTMPDVTEEQTYWGISVDTDSSYGHKDQWKIAINVWPYTHDAQVQLEDLIADSLERAKSVIAEEENNNE
tara:strand:+ start:245 stop:532 length:288 start_codon:yes stop_codon:yes gene_type:complete